jgi:N-acetylornithine carbamoyltransferase
MRDLVDGSEGGRDGLLAIVERALELRAGARPQRFEGARLAAVFLDPSLRTRTSLEAACAALGVHPISLAPGSSSWALELEDGAVMDRDKPEHVKDAVSTLSAYVDVLAVRAFAGLKDAEEDRRDPVLSAFIRHSSVPVLNLESALWHPMQGYADAATLRSRFGDLTGVPLTLTWAPHPRALPAAVPNQVALTASLLGMDVTVAHPPGFDLDPEIVARTGVKVTHDQDAALRSARVVVAKSWSGFAGYGRREDEARVRAGLSAWQVRELPAGTGFMHCLPVRRNVVVADSVIDGPDSWVRETAALRLWTAMAVLERVLGASRV